MRLKETVRKPMQEASYLSVENTDRYRSIMRLFYLHYENGIWLSNQEVVKKIRKDFDDTFSVCEEVTYEQWLARPTSMKVMQAFLNVFSTLL